LNSGRQKGLLSDFYIWISSFPYTICWRDYLFSNIGFWCLCQKSDGYSSVSLFLDLLFYSTGLQGCFCAVPCCFSFFFLAIFLSQKYGTILYKNGENGHSCIFPYFKEKDFSFSLFRTTLAIDLFYIAIVMLKCVTCIPRFSRLLSWIHLKGCQWTFLCLLKWAYDFCPLFHLYAVIC
jgi:hypothetical protein